MWWTAATQSASAHLQREFHAILDEEELRDALILVYANKQACSLHLLLTCVRTGPALRRLAAQVCTCKVDMAEGTS